MTFLATDQSEIEHRGFSMEFENGYTVSVQWGWMNYCSNRSMAAQYLAWKAPTPFKSKTAEVMITYRGAPVSVKRFPYALFGAWKHSFDESGVAANLSADSVAKFVSDVAYLTDEPI